MKVALCADLQFDEYPHLSNTLPSGITSRLQDCIDCFSWIVDTAVQEGCTKLIIAGDLFESRTELPLSVIDAACRCMDHASTAFDGEVHVVVGNHDSWLRSPDVTSVRMFEGLARVYALPSVDAPFAYVPWTDDEEDLASMVETVAKNRSAKYLVTHCLVRDIYPSGGISFAALKPRRWRRILLGDVHDPKEFRNCSYIGSPMHFDFGDAGGTRGFRILDTEADELTTVENTRSPRFVKLSSQEDIADVRAADFVRTEDAGLAEAVTATTTARVECTEVKLDETPPRLAVKSKDPHDEVLRRYCEHEGAGDDEALLEVGLDILEEAIQS